MWPICYCKRVVIDIVKGIELVSGVGDKIIWAVSVGRRWFRQIRTSNLMCAYTGQFCPENKISGLITCTHIHHWINVCFDTEEIVGYCFLFLQCYSVKQKIMRFTLFFRFFFIVFHNLQVKYKLLLWFVPFFSSSHHSMPLSVWVLKSLRFLCYLFVIH